MSYSLIHDFAEQEVVYRFTRDGLEYALISDEGWLTPCQRYLVDTRHYTTDMWLYDDDIWNAIIPRLLRERGKILLELERCKLATLMAENARLLQGKK